ncbi:MAG TPA: uroporphyrinogen-III C-methyltransferase, partial [Solimonas sp.]|nr:uroporphyrinogen-III C-methyltransferase [Solimonas sp.]
MSTPFTDPAADAAADDAGLAAATPYPMTSVAPRRRRRGLLLLIVLFAIIAVAAAWVWRQQQQLVGTVGKQTNLVEHLAQGVNALEAQADRLDTRQADLASAAQRNSGEIAEFARRIDEHDQIVGNLNEQMAGGRNRFQLNSIENLLLLANDRLLIARDVKSALVALQEADERIGSMRDPRLFNVRQAIALERAALQVVPEPDYTGAALGLSSLAGRAGRLPLRARAP